MTHIPGKVTAHYSLIQWAYWMAYCILISFSSVYLLDIGFSNTQIGILLGVSGVLSALLQPLVAAKADGLRRLSLAKFTGLFVLLMVLGLAGLLILPGFLAQGGLYLLLLILLQLIMPLTYSLGMDCVNNHIPLNFGLARGIGGGSFAVTSSLCGGLTAAYGPGAIPPAVLAAALLLLFSTLTFRHGGPVKGLPKPEALPSGERGKPFLKKYPRFLPLLAAIALLYTSHYVLMSFPYQIITSLGGGSGEMGKLLTLQGLMDIPAMIFFSLLLHKASSRLWVRLTGISFFLHALLTWAAPALPFLFGIQFLEMTGYGLFSVASVYFVNDLVDLTDRVQGQTCFTTASTIGTALSSFLGGWLLDLGGAGAALCFSTLTGLVGMVMLWGLLRQQRSAPSVQRA